MKKIKKTKKKKENKPDQKYAASAPKYIKSKQCIYDMKGRCRYGDKCKYIHRRNMYEYGNRNCIYDANGWCKYGDNCKFIHTTNKYEDGKSNIIEKLDFLMKEVLEMKKRSTYQNKKETWENPYYYPY